MEKNIKIFNFDRFSGPTAICDWLTKHNETVNVISVNSDTQGNWWIIYYTLHPGKED